MTTVDHHAAALATLHALVDAYALLPDAIDAATIPGQSRRAAPQTARAIAAAGTQYAAELAERRANRRITPAGSHPAPIPPALLDAQAVAHQAVTDSAWIAASALRRRPLLVYGAAWDLVLGAPWRARTTYLAIAIPWTSVAVAREIHGHLTRADRHLRHVLGLGDAWHRLPGAACPTCDLRTVEAECSAEDERAWTIRCAHGCWVTSVEEYGRKHGRLGDLLALIRSVRRQMTKRDRRERAAA